MMCKILLVALLGLVLVQSELSPQKVKRSSSNEDSSSSSHLDSSSSWMDDSYTDSDESFSSSDDEDDFWYDPDLVVPPPGSPLTPEELIAHADIKKQKWIRQMMLRTIPDMLSEHEKIDVKVRTQNETSQLLGEVIRILEKIKEKKNSLTPYRKMMMKERISTWAAPIQKLMGTIRSSERAEAENKRLSAAKVAQKRNRKTCGGGASSRKLAKSSKEK